MLRWHVLQEDPEITDFKNAAADTANDVKKSVKPDDKASTKSSSDKTVMESVSCLSGTIMALCQPLVAPSLNSSRRNIQETASRKR